VRPAAACRAFAALSCAALAALTVPDAAKLVAKLSANCLNISLDDGSSVGLGIYPLCSMANHSDTCEPHPHLWQIHPATPRRTAAAYGMHTCMRCMHNSAHEQEQKRPATLCEGAGASACMRCRPNAAQIFRGGRLHLRAVRAISVGEEVCITYAGLEDPSFERREHMLRSFSFDSCPHVRSFSASLLPACPPAHCHPAKHTLCCHVSPPHAQLSKS
jgi:hypothetical protein